MTAPDDTLPSVDLPAWAIVGTKRRAHIARVTRLLDQWAGALRLPSAEALAWHDAGRWHDALREADEGTLRALTHDRDTPAAMLHGPASAAKLADAGETRTDVLDAIRWHTVGHPDWSRTGRALYMADFLEPGRTFMVAERAFVAGQVQHDFAGAFRQVARMRIEWLVREGCGIAPQTAEMWNRECSTKPRA